MFSHDETKPGVEILLDAGGDHQFNLGHLRREGAPRLIRMLLQTAGYRRSLRWNVRVEKKFGCGPETRPITVVSSKPWCVYLKIKPGDNNTAHFCSLLMPNGYRGEAVYEDLKEVEVRVNAAWRRGFDGDVVPMEETPQHAQQSPPELPADPPPLPFEAIMAATPNVVVQSIPAPEDEAPEEPEEVATPPEPAADAEADDESSSSSPEVSELWGFSSDPDKVRLTLLAIHEVCDENRARNLDQFVQNLVPKMGWQTLRRKQIGGLFTALVRRGLIARVNRGSTPVAYELTPEGRAFIDDLLPGRGVPPTVPASRHAGATAAQVPPTLPASARPALGPPMADSVGALSTLVERLNQDVKKLSELQARRAAIAAELDSIDGQVRDLNRRVNNPQLQEMIRLLLAAGG